MNSLITWTDGPYSSVTARLKTRRLGSISYGTNRSAPDSEKYILRLSLIGGEHESKHPDTETAKVHAERVLLRQMELIGFVPVENLEQGEGTR